MNVLDLAYHMRDHTPQWLLRLNLVMIPLALIWAATLWWPAIIGAGLLMLVNVVVGVRSFTRKAR